MADEDDDAGHEEYEEGPAAHYYANDIGTILGPADLTIEFGFQVGAGELSHLAAVTMSWEEALVLHRYLEVAIRSYEQEMGPIRDIEGLDRHPGNGGLRRSHDEEEDDNGV